MNSQLPIEIMNANKLMRSRAEVVAFEEAMAELAKNPKNEYLPELHLVLDDECEHYEVMYGLIHFLESFDAKEQLQAFIDVAPKLILHASNWIKTLLYGILNDDPSRALYKELLHSANSESRDVVYQLLKEIAANESPPLSSPKMQLWLINQSSAYEAMRSHLLLTHKCDHPSLQSRLCDRLTQKTQREDLTNPPFSPLLRT